MSDEFVCSLFIIWENRNINYSMFLSKLFFFFVIVESEVVGDFIVFIF